MVARLRPHLRQGAKLAKTRFARPDWRQQHQCREIVYFLGRRRRQHRAHAQSNQSDPLDRGDTAEGADRITDTFDPGSHPIRRFVVVGRVTSPWVVETKCRQILFRRL